MKKWMAASRSEIPSVDDHDVVRRPHSAGGASLPRAPSFCVRLRHGRVTCQQRVPEHPALDFVAELERLARFFHERLPPLGTVCIASTQLSAAAALSYPGTILVDDSLLDRPATLLYRFLPHEFAHQWFGHLVTFHGEHVIWLNEGLPEYLQLLFLRSRFGERMLKKGLDYCARLHARLAYSCETPNGISQQVIEQELEAIRGTGVWRILHLLIGDDALWKALRILCRNRNAVSAEEVLSLVESLTDISLESFRAEQLGWTQWPLPVSRPPIRNP